MTRLRWTVVSVALLGCFEGAAVLAEEPQAAQPDPKANAQWSAKLRQWRKAFTSDEAGQVERWEAVRKEIAQIDDPAAIPSILSLLKTEKESQFRRALIQPLIKLGGEDAVAMLVKLSVEDENPVLREEAARGLAGKQELPQHLDKYIAYLYKPRYSAAAAQALRWNQLAVRESQTDPLNQDLTKALIAALVQKQKKLVPYWMAYDTGPTAATPEGTYAFIRGNQVEQLSRRPTQTGRAAGYREGWIEVLVSTRNEQVLHTLKSYTLTEYGYDQKAWTENLLTQRR